MKAGRGIKLTAFTKNKFTAAINTVIQPYAIATFVLIEPHAGVAVCIRNSEMHTGIIFQEEVTGHRVAGFLDGV